MCRQSDSEVGTNKFAPTVFARICVLLSEIIQQISNLGAVAQQLLGQKF